MYQPSVENENSQQQTEGQPLNILLRDSSQEAESRAVPQSQFINYQIPFSNSVNFYPIQAHFSEQDLAGLGVQRDGSGFFLPAQHQMKRRARREIFLTDAQRDLAARDQMMMRMFKDSYFRRNFVGEAQANRSSRNQARRPKTSYQNKRRSLNTGQLRNLMKRKSYQQQSDLTGHYEEQANSSMENIRDNREELHDGATDEADAAEKQGVPVNIQTQPAVFR